MSEPFSMLFAAAAVLLLSPAPVRYTPEVATFADDPRRSREERSVLVRLRPLLSGLSIVGGWAFVEGAFGLVAGLVGGVLAWRALSGLESPQAIRRRRELERDLPTAVHLLGACLVAGSPMSAALAAVGASMEGAIGDELALVHRRLHLGVDPATVWRSIDGPLEPLGRSMARAHESGSSVRQAVARLAEDLRSETRARTDALARTVEVRAAAPLGLCFLPAFVLLGVVPMTAGLFSSLALFR